jgi:hypothetical protein
MMRKYDSPDDAQVMTSDKILPSGSYTRTPRYLPIWENLGSPGPAHSRQRGVIMTIT